MQYICLGLNHWSSQVESKCHRTRARGSGILGAGSIASTATLPSASGDTTGVGGRTKALLGKGGMAINAPGQRKVCCDHFRSVGR